MTYFVGEARKYIPFGNDLDEESYFLLMCSLTMPSKFYKSRKAIESDVFDEVGHNSL